MYDISVNLIPGLPQIPFRNGIGAYEGVVMHSTAVYNDSAEGERNYETGHFNDAFVHTFTDDTKILQIASFDYISYGCCYTGNQRYLNNELCQSYDSVKFNAAYDRWVWLAAKQLYARKLGVADNVTLRSHKQVSDEWHESDHQDPIDYLASHGKTWADVVFDVTAYYKQFEEEDILMAELKAQVEALTQRVATLESQLNDQDPPDWFLKEIPMDSLKGVIDTPKGPFIFWRLVAVIFRLVHKN